MQGQAGNAKWRLGVLGTITATIIFIFRFLSCPPCQVVIPPQQRLQSLVDIHSSDSPSVCPPGGWLAPSLGGRVDPWMEMKIHLRPAQCLVRGMWEIEELDPEHNFRRPYSLAFESEVEDKTHLLPWLLAFRDRSLQTRPRRVYLDLGGNEFRSSVYWMLRNYPLDFTEIHVFESARAVFVLPRGNESRSVKVYLPNAMSRMVHTPRTPNDIPLWALKRIRFYNDYVAHMDDPRHRIVDITRFIKQELKLTKEDTLIVKMDIEGAEWAILSAWAEDPEMVDIVDEIFVELHYRHPSMAGFDWNVYPKSRRDAVDLFVRLRDRGFYVHPWP